MDERTLDELLECSICLERLDATAKVLPCQHTFCRKCLEKLVASSRENKLSCPECRDIVNQSVDRLPANLLLKKLLDGLPKQPITKPESHATNSKENIKPFEASSEPMAIAKYDYEKMADVDLGLAFKKNDVIQIWKFLNRDYAHGSISPANMGIFHVAFVKLNAAALRMQKKLELDLQKGSERILPSKLYMSISQLRKLTPTKTSECTERCPRFIQNHYEQQHQPRHLQLHAHLHEQNPQHMQHYSNIQQQHLQQQQKPQHIQQHSNIQQQRVQQHPNNPQQHVQQHQQYIQGQPKIPQPIPVQQHAQQHSNIQQQHMQQHSNIQQQHVQQHSNIQQQHPNIQQQHPNIQQQHQQYIQGQPKIPQPIPVQQQQPTQILHGAVDTYNRRHQNPPVQNSKIPDKCARNMIRLPARGVAVMDYRPKHRGEIELKKGQTYTVLEFVQGEFCRGKSAQNIVGYFPMKCINFQPLKIVAQARPGVIVHTTNNKRLFGQLNTDETVPRSSIASSRHSVPTQNEGLSLGCYQFRRNTTATATQTQVQAQAQAQSLATNIEPIDLTNENTIIRPLTSSNAMAANQIFTHGINYSTNANRSQITHVRSGSCPIQQLPTENVIYPPKLVPSTSQTLPAAAGSANCHQKSQSLDNGNSSRSSSNSSQSSNNSYGGNIIA